MSDVMAGLRSCDFTDAGCTDADCRYCYGGERELPERLRTLASNLAIAGALCRSYRLGGEACTCDVGPSGHEWHPGMGCSPESIADRKWNRYEHNYNGGPDEYDLCSECNHTSDYFLHWRCPECFTDFSEASCECGKNTPPRAGGNDE